MKKLRAWKEEWSHRSMPTPEGPMVAHRGQIVVVVVVDNWEAAASVTALLDDRDGHAPKT